MLKPGQQAQVMLAAKEHSTDKTVMNGIQLINNPNIDKVTAWKNGLFNFEGASLAEIMEQLERWYDLTVVYEKGIPNIRFFGKISRHVKLTGVIKALEESEVHFRLEDDRRAGGDALILILLQR